MKWPPMAKAAAPTEPLGKAVGQAGGVVEVSRVGVVVSERLTLTPVVGMTASLVGLRGRALHPASRAIEAIGAVHRVPSKTTILEDEIR